MKGREEDLEDEIFFGKNFLPSNCKPNSNEMLESNDFFTFT